jgi:AsmA-like C-terminal region
MVRADGERTAAFWKNEVAQEAGLGEQRAGFWRRNRWIMWVAGGLLTTAAVMAMLVAVALHRAEPFLRARIVAALEKRFHARVELDSFHISYGNGLHGRWGVFAEGRGLRMWPLKHPEDEDLSLRTSAKPLEGEGLSSKTSGAAADAPLIRVDEFHFHAPLRYERGKPIRISLVHIEGLTVVVPPRRHDAGKAGAEGTASAASQPGPAAGPSASKLESKKQSKDAGLLSDVVVERVQCDNAQLTLETDKPNKLPLGFAIAHLTLTTVTADGPISYQAELTNPRPLGQIHTTGTFGPWQADDPGGSAVIGDYRFDDADLSGFKGIAGILNSTGHYQGTLRNIQVDGETATPDFRLTHFGNPMALHTSFHATVDGTDGDTWLDPVDATLGQSHFTARGQVVRLKNENADALQNLAATSGDSAVEKDSPFHGGHDIALTVNVDRGRIEDFLRLASHDGKTILTGAVTLKTTLHITPGPEQVVERLKLNGAFKLDDALFASTKIQGNIRQLSLRGQGRPQEVKRTDPAGTDSSISSGMQGDFQMANGVVTLPDLKYTVPGAAIQLKGTYGVEGGALDFGGTAQLQATVSEMVGGWKGLLLKPADRFFKKDGAGTEVPIRVSGTREEPKFGVDFGRMKGTSPETPGQK